MKVAIVSRETREDQFFGLGRAMHRFAEGLRIQGHEVSYYSKVDWTEHDDNLYRCWQKRLARLFKWGGLSLTLAPAWAERIVQARVAARLIKQYKPTHIWFQDPWLAIAFFYMSRGGHSFLDQVAWGISEHGLGSFAMAVQFDGLHLNQRTLKLLLRLEYFILKRAQWVFCPSQTALKTLCDHFLMNKPQAHWSVLPYGLPDRLDLSPQQARKLLGWTDEVHYVLAVGRIAPVKHMDWIVKACAVVEQTLNTPIQLVILGEGQRNIVLKCAQQTGLTRPPFIHLTEDVRPYLVAAHVYISASRHESFGLANQEAIAAGLPCILMEGGATCEIADEGAWIVSSQNGLTSALGDMLQNNSTSHFWCNMAHKRRQRWPTWQSLILRCEQQLKEKLRTK